MAAKHAWQAIAAAAGFALFIFVIAAVLFVRAQKIMEQQIRDRLQSVAAAAAMQFDGKVLDAIHNTKDMKKQVFIQTVSQLRRIQDEMPEVSSAYLMRRTAVPDLVTFIADADSLNTLAEVDDNKNGIIDDSEKPSWPGDTYDASVAPALLEGFEHPSADAGITYDQWGPTVSGYAPVRRSDNGKIVAMLGLDMRADDYVVRAESILPPALFLLLMIGTCAITASIVYILSQRRLQEWRTLDQERAGLMLLTFHQLGGPLTIFKWSLESLVNRAPDEKLEDLVKEHIHSMENGIKRMDGMLNDLRGAAQVQEGRVDVRHESISVTHIIEEVARGMAEQFHDQGVHLSVSASDKFLVESDGVIIRDVVHQLLTNALNFNHRDGHVSVVVRPVSGAIQVEVIDDGAGIPNADKKRLFAKFVRGSNAPRFKPDGNGLGLFIAKGLIDALGGKLTMKSREGEGTTVTFTIPV